MGEKNLVNSLEDCVDECLGGFSKMNPNLQYYEREKIFLDATWRSKQKIGLVSGGGSGHEPFPAGYVGEGMLTASVSGSIFASPPPNHVLRAIRLAGADDRPVLLIIPNYTGDVLNFGLAAEMAIAEGIRVEVVVAGEDVAPGAFGVRGKAPGKRGASGLVFLFKIAGHLSRTVESSSKAKKILTDVIDSMASLSLCLNPCNKPGERKLFELADDETELGVGVHGESGVVKLKLLSARESAEKILDSLIRESGSKGGDRVAAMVDNLGSSSVLEQWLVAGEIEKQLSSKSICVSRLYAGRFFTSLNMAGVQVCILKLKPENGDLFLEALDRPTTAFAWPKTFRRTPRTTTTTTTADAKIELCKERKASLPKGFSIGSRATESVKACLTKAAEALIAEESRLNYLDGGCGDGDCGTTLSRLAREIRSGANANRMDFSNPCRLFFELSSVAREAVGGTSGALYGLFFGGVAAELAKYENYESGHVFSKSWRAGIDLIKKYSSARLGDRTMLDSLEIGCEAFESEIERDPKSILNAFKCAAKAAEEGCEKTKLMTASAGRASYTDGSRQRNVDAGAYAVTVWLSAIYRTIPNTDRR